MSVVVKKFGGSSLANLERIEFIADQISNLYQHQQKQRMVIVVSAMQGDTDQLEDFAYKISSTPDLREMSALLATGEQKIIALLAIALLKRGCPAVSYTGLQLGIETDGLVNKARVKNINIANVQQNLSEGKIVIVAGFQGYDQNGNITTLGRGGSDLTAVALAIALNAKQCNIYTDVDGVYTADPRLEPNAVRLGNIHFSEMLQLSGLGAKVMQIKAVALAAQYNMPIKVSSSFNGLNSSGDDLGTVINNSYDFSDSSVIKVASLSEQVKVSINNINYRDLNFILQSFAKLQIKIDMVDTKGASLGADLLNDLNLNFNVSFVVNKRDLELCEQVLAEVNIDQNSVMYSLVGKISLIGVSLVYITEIISKIYNDLLNHNILVIQLSASAIKVSILVNDKDLEGAVNILHTAFSSKQAIAGACC